MSESQVAIAQPKPRASHSLAALMGMEPTAMLDTIKAQCFKGNPANISDAQLAAFVSIAAEMGVNPLLPGMLYAFPVQGGGIVPMMGPDGVYKKLTENPNVESWETVVYPEDVALPPTHAVTRIYRKGVERPLAYTALLSEWKVGANPNWNSRPRHMLSLRSLKQCARMIIHGIPFDEDERSIMQAIDVGPGVPEAAVTRPTPPPRAPRAAKGVNAIIDDPKAGAPAEAVTEVASTPVAPAPAAPEPPKSAPEAPKAEPRTMVTTEGATRTESAPEVAKRVAAPATSVPQPRAFLNDGETMVADCDIKAIATTTIRLPDGLVHPTVQAKVSGDFNGDVYHFDGATVVTPAVEASGAGPAIPAVCTPNKPWAEGQRLRLTLLGYKNKKGEVKATVQKVEEMEGF